MADSEIEILAKAADVGETLAKFPEDCAAALQQVREQRKIMSAAGLIPGEPWPPMRTRDD